MQFSRINMTSAKNVRLLVLWVLVIFFLERYQPQASLTLCAHTHSHQNSCHGTKKAAVWRQQKIKSCFVTYDETIYSHAQKWNKYRNYLLAFWHLFGLLVLVHHTFPFEFLGVCLFGLGNYVKMFWLVKKVHCSEQLLEMSTFLFCKAKHNVQTILIAHF